MSDPLPPPNTVIVLSKPLPMNRGALWTLFLTLGLLMGLFLRSLIDEGTMYPTQTGSAPGLSQSSTVPLLAPTEALWIGTVVADLHNALFPSPTATNTPRPTVLPVLTPTPKVDFCGTQVAGRLCQVPEPTPRPPTPYPSCLTQVDPGDWCRWPTATATATPIAQVVALWP